MKEDILNRIRKAMQQYGLSERAFAIEIGLTPQSFNNQMRGQNALNLDTILGILSTYDDISANWLIKGEGSMYIGDVIENNNTQRVDHIENSHVYQNQNGTQTVNADKSLEDRIKALEDERQSMKEHIQRQEKLIDQLINK